MVLMVLAEGMVAGVLLVLNVKVRMREITGVEMYILGLLFLNLGNMEAGVRPPLLKKNLGGGGGGCISYNQVWHSR